jgi:hypothetical protein
VKQHSSFSILRALFVAVVAFNPSSANAVASYARQTGLACNGCHTTPPELNSAGRTFKLLGYTDRALDTGTVSSAPGERHSALDLLKALPLSALVETSFTSTKSAQPGAQNHNFEFPQDVSLFLAGAWTKHVGSFIQLTYNVQNDHFSIDNSDIRYANKGKLAGKELVYGLTLNNNPTVEDLWNSTPAWGYPWIASDSAPTPSARPLVQGGLAQDVAGIGGYVMWNDHLYLAGAIYRSDHVGSPQPTSGGGFDQNIRNVAPYWRVAWQESIGNYDYLEIGGYGMHVTSSPNAIAGLENKYTDWAMDLQYDRTLFVKDVLSIRGTYIHESSSLAATFNQGNAVQVRHSLRTFTANAEYHVGNRYSATLGWFNVNGTPDALLYAPASLTGSANGSPKSTGYIANVSWWPMQNLQAAFQYTAYTRFNGAATNYDGAGRNASDNNTAYVLARFIF